MSDDLISRQAAIALAKDICVPTKDGTIYSHRCIDPGDIAELPSAEQERTAKVEYIAEVYRVEVVDHYLKGICGICGEDAYDRAKYCSECGAKLDWNLNE